MVAIALLFTLPGLLTGANARRLPTRTAVGRKAAIEAAPAAGPTTPLVSDFKKGNVSATWAEGHPKIWSQELKKFDIVLPASLTSRGSDGAVTEDGKFVILVNQTAIQVVNPDTGATVSTIAKEVTINYNYPKIAVISKPGGGYSIFESYDNDGSKTVEQRLSQDGAAVGQPVVRPGKFSSFDGPQFSKDKSSFLTINGQVAQLYNIDDPDSIISLAGHTQGIMSAQFSPDGKYVSTTSWDSYTKLWDRNGKLIKSIGPSGGQNWYTSFSPDSKTLLYTVGSGDPRIDRVPVDNPTAKPERVGISGWARSVAWSPDGQFIAYSTSSSQVNVVKASDGSLVQRWQAAASYQEPSKVRWLDGGKKLAFHINHGLEVYDFEKNLKYRWGPDELDQYNTDLNGYYEVASKGWIATTDADQQLRLWAYPA